VNHRLLILRPEKSDPFLTAEFHDPLTEARDVSVTKNAPDPIDKSVFPTISFDELARHESNDGLPGS